MNKASIRARGLALAFVFAATTALAQSSTAPRQYLRSGEYMTDGQYLVSENRAFFATQQNDGNLCVYKGSGPGDNQGYLWCNGSNAAIGKYFVMQQGDGNVCVRKGAGPGDSSYHWCNMKNGANGDYFLIVQGDGNLCTYRGTGPADNRGYQWCSGATSAVSWQPPNDLASKLQPVGTPAVYRAATPGYDPNFPKGQPCPTAVYKVPPGVGFVRITAAGGAGVGGDSANLVQTVVAMAGMVGGSNVNAPSSVSSWANISGGNGGRGATVSAIYAVKAGQQLYVVAGMNGHSGMKSGRGIYSSGYPGGGYGFHPGGGFSMVSTERPARTSDPNTCAATPASILMVAGGGGGGGSAGTAGSGGSGGDAGLLYTNAGSGNSGGGSLSGGGGGGGTQTTGGNVGSHPGCGSELRSAGSFLRGSDNGGYGGAGGAGYYGGGGGGSGDCFLNTGHAGGGGGSSYVSRGAMNARSSLDAKYDPQVVIQPMR